MGESNGKSRGGVWVEYRRLTLIWQRWPGADSRVAVQTETGVRQEDGYGQHSGYRSGGTSGGLGKRPGVWRYAVAMTQCFPLPPRVKGKGPAALRP